MNIEKLIDAGVTYLNALTELTKARTARQLEDNKYADKWHTEDMRTLMGETPVSVPVAADQEPKKIATKATKTPAADDAKAAALADYEKDAAAARAADEAKAAAQHEASMLAADAAKAAEAKAAEAKAAEAKAAEAKAAEAKAADPIDYDKQVAPVLQLKALAQRAAVIALLAEFGVKNGKALKPEQYADFLVKINDDTYLDSLI